MLYFVVIILTYTELWISDSNQCCQIAAITALLLFQDTLVSSKCCQIVAIMTPWHCSVAKFEQTITFSNPQLTTLTQTKEIIGIQAILSVDVLDS